MLASTGLMITLLCMVSGFRVWFRVSGLRFRVYTIEGVQVRALGFCVEFRLSGLAAFGFRVYGGTIPKVCRKPVL